MDFLELLPSVFNELICCDIEFKIENGEETKYLILEDEKIDIFNEEELKKLAKELGIK
jgi:hypothetical protein